MKKQNSIRKMGFSLIELSIVILVIGILVAGITKGGAIMTKARIGSAKALTSSSPVAIIPDLVAWYEPVLESSFNAAQAVDGTLLAVSNGAAWFDNSPYKANNVTAVVGTGITYKESSINSLPAVKFAGGASSLTFNSSPLNQKDYTVFVVEQRLATGSATVGRFLSLGGSSGTGAANLGYAPDTTSSLITMPGSGTVSVPVYSRPTPRIITFLSSSTVMTATKGVFLNGGSGTILANAAANAPLTATSTGYIGRDDSTSFYNGEIAEIIIYNRALKVDERNDIQNYLSKKYGIKVTTSV